MLENDPLNAAPSETTETPPTEAPQTGVNTPEPTPQAAEPPLSPPAAAPPAAAQQDRAIPHEAFIAQRVDLQMKLRERDQEIARLRHQQDERERRERELSEQAPDMFRDPDGYRDWIFGQVDRRTQQVVQPLKHTIADLRLQNSELRASTALGPDRWRQLNAWIKQQPRDVQDDFRHAPDPYGAAWQEYRRTTTFQQLGPKSLDEFVAEATAKARAEWEAEHGAPPAAEPEAQPPQAEGQPRAADGTFAPKPPPPAPRRSAPSLNQVGGSPPATSAPGSGYDALFKRA